MTCACGYHLCSVQPKGKAGAATPPNALHLVHYIAFQAVLAPILCADMRLQASCLLVQGLPDAHSTFIVVCVDALNPTGA